MKRIAGEDGTCWASRETLSKQCGISVGRFRKSIKYLITHGWIELLGKKRVVTDGGIQEVNEYRIADLWDTNNSFYKDKYKGVPERAPLSKGGSSETPPIYKGGSRTLAKGGHGQGKGGSSGDPKEEPYNNIHNKEEPHGGQSTDSLEEMLPIWLDKEVWNNWVSYRKEKRQTLTKRSIDLQLKELGKDVSTHIAVIEQSIRNGWTGLFPLKEKGTQSTVYKNNESDQARQDKYDKIKNKVHKA